MKTAENVNPAEIEKFERMASRWWDRNGEFKPIHMLNPIRANFIDRLSNVAEKDVLDVGCGGGILSEALTQRGATVTGIDMGEAPLEVARLHALESGLTINYQRATAESYAEDHPQQFDVVCCLEMLEHVPQPQQVIEACAKLVKPGGHLFFSTINRNPKAYLMAVLGAEYILKWLPKGTHEYKHFIKPAELALWLRQFGLQFQNSAGFIYNPFTQTFSESGSDIDVNYIVHATKPA